ncbi:MAG TPA: hypothetical protein VHN99_09035 [Deinococcales bacterium]|nr:hypothetical protein [Deinococcales bacterium]
MILLALLALIVAVNVWLYLRSRRVAAARRARGDVFEDSELDALGQAGAYGGFIGSAYLRKAGIERGEEAPVREDTEPVRFKFDDEK